MANGPRRRPYPFLPAFFPGAFGLTPQAECQRLFSHSQTLKSWKALGGAVAPESPPLPLPPGFPSVPGRGCAPLRPPRAPARALAGPGDRVFVSGALWPPPGATPCGPGLNLDSAWEPETRERGRKPGKTRGSRNAQQLLRCPGRGDFWRARGRVQSATAKGHVFSADRPCVRVDNSENRTQKCQEQDRTPGTPTLPSHPGLFLVLARVFLSPFKMEVEIQFSCLSLL